MHSTSQIERAKEFGPTCFIQQVITVGIRIPKHNAIPGAEVGPDHNSFVAARQHFQGIDLIQPKIKDSFGRSSDLRQSFFFAVAEISDWPEAGVFAKGHEPPVGLQAFV